LVLALRAEMSIKAVVGSTGPHWDTVMTIESAAIFDERNRLGRTIVV
jgi:hypothetical protein